MSKYYLFATSLIIFVIIIILIAFSISGTPFEQKAISLDKTRLNNLLSIKQSIITYSSSKNELPKTLSQIETNTYSYNANNSVILDPQTKKPIDYKILSLNSYQLCSTFSIDSSKQDPNTIKELSTQIGSYKKGYNCFTFQTSLGNDFDTNNDVMNILDMLHHYKMRWCGIPAKNTYPENLNTLYNHFSNCYSDIIGKLKKQNFTYSYDKTKDNYSLCVNWKNKAKECYSKYTVHDFLYTSQEANTSSGNYYFLNPININALPKESEKYNQELESTSYTDTAEGRDAKRKADLEALEYFIDSFKLEYGRYPSTLNTLTTIDNYLPSSRHYNYPYYDSTNIEKYKTAYTNDSLKFIQIEYLPNLYGKSYQLCANYEALQNKCIIK